MELKEWTASEIEDYDDARLELSEDGQVSCTKLYIKSDADAVLAEKDKMIVALEERIAEGDRDFEWAEHQNERLLQIVRHQKYKRCLAMAKWCKSEQTYSSFSIYATEHPKSRWASKSVGAGNWIAFWNNRERRWRELAEKFKEGK